jgi:aminodeoxyfutalosine synthase
MDPALSPIAEKVYAGQRLSADDGLALLRSRDVWTIGELADHVRRRLHGNAAYYNINRHINYSNICALSCKFCAFYRKKGDDGAYEFSVEDVARQAVEAANAGATEVHIVGGLHPWLGFDYYTDMLRAIRERAPRLHIKAFTAVEIVHLARIAKRGGNADGIRSVLADLKDAGLGSLPGGGAEVFDDRVHDEAFKGKIRSGQWIEVHRIAHELGLMSNATILYGHIESLEDRVHHFCLLREAQDEAIAAGAGGRFQTVIPLPFIPDDSELEHLYGPTGLDDLKMLAISRLMLDNFAHVKAFWIMQTLALSQTALHHGVDDIDGTVVWYDITKLGGKDDISGGTHQEVTVGDLRKAIMDAGYEPVERDTLYRPIVREGADWDVAEAGLGVGV